jgi:hypothetical protein
VAIDTTGVDDVIELMEYHDGPRTGIATYAGRAHRFQSQMVDIFGPGDAEDIFLLTRLDDPTVAAISMYAEFEVAPNSPQAGPGVWPKFKVRWRPVEKHPSGAKNVTAK